MLSQLWNILYSRHYIEQIDRQYQPLEAQYCRDLQGQRSRSYCMHLFHHTLQSISRGIDVDIYTNMMDHAKQNILVISEGIFLPSQETGASPPLPPSRLHPRLKLVDDKFTVQV